MQVLASVLRNETSRLKDYSKFSEVAGFVTNVMKRDQGIFQIWLNRNSNSVIPLSAEALKESGALIFSTYSEGQINPKFYFLKIAFDIIDDE